MMTLTCDKSERAYFGVYIPSYEFADKMYAAQLRHTRIIYSHETALFLHGLTDREPFGYTITVPTGYNAAQLRKEGFSVFPVKRELYEIGIMPLTTMYGHDVIAYNAERTICDCLQSRNKTNTAVVTGAIKRYVRRQEKNLNTLMRMADIFNVTNPLMDHLEVLL